MHIVLTLFFKKGGSEFYLPPSEQRESNELWKRGESMQALPRKDSACTVIHMCGKIYTCDVG